MTRLISLVSILLIPAFIVSVHSNDEVPDLDDLLLWAFSDPIEEPNVDGLPLLEFYNGIQKVRSEHLVEYKSSNVTGAIQILNDNIKISTINWADVFTTIEIRKKPGQGEHGMASLVAWAMRETGPESAYPSIRKSDFIKFLISRKVSYTIVLRRGHFNFLINDLNSFNDLFSSSTNDWKTIINDLKDNRQLLKHACGIMNLELCDTEEEE